MRVKLGPKYYPFFQDISIDWVGRIFVKTYERVKDNESFYYYDVLDSGGRYIAKVPIKIRSRGLFWKKNKLYTVEMDEQGFQRVKRYKVNWKI